MKGLIVLFYLLLASLDESERSLAEQTYNKYQNRMYTIAYSILKNEHDAEDALEDAAIKIIKNIGEFKNITCNKTEALIVLYIKSSAIDILRKRTRRPLLTVDDDEAPELADESELLENTVITNMVVETIKKYIECLKPQYKEVLIYKYYYEKSDREIAELLLINENVVRTRLTRARDIIRKKIEVKND